MQPASLGIDDILPSPENRPHPGRPDGEPDRETRRRREIGGPRRIDLVQGRPHDTAAQRRIETGSAEAHLPDSGRHGAQRRFREPAAQIIQGERV